MVIIDCFHFLAIDYTPAAAAAAISLEKLPPTPAAAVTFYVCVCIAKILVIDTNTSPGASNQLA